MVDGEVSVMTSPLWMALALPAVGALVAWLVGRKRPEWARGVALDFSIVTALVTLWLALPVWKGATITWSWGAGGLLRLALDGLSAPLLLLTVFLGVISVLASWNVRMRPASHFALLLLLQAAVAAVFLADGVVLFYMAWEAVLIPMFFLIGVWGHENRRHAAMKFFLFTFVGSALMLVGLLIAAGGAIDVSVGLRGLAGAVHPELQPLVFWLLFAGFAVKVPVWPLHTWLPDAHVEAPTAGSIMLAGVLLKMGGYGFLRLALPFAPEAAEAAAPVLATLGIVGIVYGALMALAQTDLKRLVAYSSVSHMGFVVLAIAVGTPLALAAAMLGMVAHGVTAALLFLLVGTLYERTHTRDMERLGGLLRTLPMWGTAFVFACLASLGLPGLAGFPGELATSLEAFKAYGWWMIAVVFGVVLAGAYNLRAVRKVAQGPVGEGWEALPDLAPSEWAAAGLLAASVLVLGLAPGIVASVVGPVVTALAGVGG
jgi:NADH-quinone oxidoreductase subunit M